MQIQEAINTLRDGIQTILNCDVPYEQMDAALKLVEEKLTTTNSDYAAAGHDVAEYAAWHTIKKYIKENQKPTTNKAMVLCEAHDPVDAGCCCVKDWLCGTKPCYIAQDNSAIRCKKG